MLVHQRVYIYTWLVVTGTMEFYDFPIILGIILGIIIPSDELHHFSEGLKPPTRYELRLKWLKTTVVLQKHFCQRCTRNPFTVIQAILPPKKQSITDNSNCWDVSDIDGSSHVYIYIHIMIYDVIQDILCNTVYIYIILSIDTMLRAQPQHWKSCPVPRTSARWFGGTCARRQAAGWPMLTTHLETKLNNLRSRYVLHILPFGYLT